MDLLCDACFKTKGPCEEKTIGMVQPAPCAVCGIPIEPWTDKWHAVSSQDVGLELLALGAADFEESLKSEAGLKATLESCIHIMETSTIAERPILESSGVISDFHRVVREAQVYPLLFERAFDLSELLLLHQIELDPLFKNN
jgi:hypothetical protein